MLLVLLLYSLSSIYVYIIGRCIRRVNNKWGGSGTTTGGIPPL